MQNRSSTNHSPRRRLSALLGVIVVPAALFSITGCTTMDGDATGSTSTGSTLKHVVSRGYIERGYTEAEVTEAWGNPSSKTVAETPQGPLMAWTYVKNYNGHGGGHHGIPRGWVQGKKGMYYSSDSYYPAPHTSQTLAGESRTEVPVKRAYFKDGKVVSFQERHANNES